MSAIIVDDGYWSGVVKFWFFLEIVLAVNVFYDFFVLILDIFDLALKVLELEVQRFNLLCPL